MLIWNAAIITPLVEFLRVIRQGETLVNSLKFNRSSKFSLPKYDVSDTFDHKKEMISHCLALEHEVEIIN